MLFYGLSAQNQHVNVTDNTCCRGVLINCIKPYDFRLICGKLSGDSEARILAKERIFDGWMSIVSALYIT